MFGCILRFPINSQLLAYRQSINVVDTTAFRPVDLRDNIECRPDEFVRGCISDRGPVARV
ncbi:MAG: hypothetical protein B7Z55_10960 [Planctomycetales bacterium 12-60-4]|nr:MAG: hypothetical protein B7Z55_10960 [Planctomycetales bacterium 12-60-4]